LGAFLAGLSPVASGAHGSEVLVSVVVSTDHVVNFGGFFAAQVAAVGVTLKDSTSDVRPVLR
jgi:uncharacterized membrane protein (DUF441 family)